jgi:putative GTP pyrophosphokinase
VRATELRTPTEREPFADHSQIADIYACVGSETSRVFSCMQQANRGNGAAPLSKAEIDRLGARLSADIDSDDDLRVLDRFRRSHAAAYEHTVHSIREALQVAPTGRPSKSTTAIRDKLRRASIRLSQMQDVAGCRLIVEHRKRQDALVAQLIRLFPESTVVDRRDKPSHGYRAVHVIVRIGGTPVEVQVRTEPQHAWAEYAEKLADTIDPALKYGGGPEDPRAILHALSNVARFVEQIELDGVAQHQQFAAALAEVASRLADLHRE